ncbi:hypothetical protein HDU93_006498, partial [Gonapodya sp. JEL0774]
QTFVEGGWCKTGDLGYRDAEGFYYAVDRLKDMLLRGGENVYCVEVENVLNAHPAVSDSAVVGLPHPTLFEEVGAAVHIRPSHQHLLDSAESRNRLEEDVKAYAKKHLGGFKVPVFVAMKREELPRNANGKLMKKEIKDIVNREWDAVKTERGIPATGATHTSHDPRPHATSK